MCGLRLVPDDGGVAGPAGGNNMTDHLHEQVNLFVVEQHLRHALTQVAELTEMLTAATDTATQRGKQLDAILKLCEKYARSGSGDELPLSGVLEILSTWGGDGG
jgi:hypothetical protein